MKNEERNEQKGKGLKTQGMGKMETSRGNMGKEKQKSSRSLGMQGEPTASRWPTSWPTETTPGH